MCARSCWWTRGEIAGRYLWVVTTFNLKNKTAQGIPANYRVEAVESSVIISAREVVTIEADAQITAQVADSDIRGDSHIRAIQIGN